EVLETTDFDDKWNRVIKFRGPEGTGTFSLPQHLQYLNTSHLRVDCTRDSMWSSFYLTRELGPDVVRRILMEHADFQDPPTLTPAQRVQRRFRLYHFMVHAGWLT